MTYDDRLEHPPPVVVSSSGISVPERDKEGQISSYGKLLTSLISLLSWPIPNPTIRFVRLSYLCGVPSHWLCNLAGSIPESTSISLYASSGKGQRLLASLEKTNRVQFHSFVTIDLCRFPIYWFRWWFHPPRDLTSWPTRKEVCSIAWKTTPPFISPATRLGKEASGSTSCHAHLLARIGKWSHLLG